MERVFRGCNHVLTLCHCVSRPAEVDGGVVVVLCLGVGGVAVRERAEKCVGKQAGYLLLRQSDGRGVSPLKQRDGLKKHGHALLSSRSSSEL